MFVRCEDSKEIVTKDDNERTKRTFVFLVLFSVTLSALGISCFALLSVQKLSNDLDALRVVLRKSRFEPAKQHVHAVLGNARPVGPLYETPTAAIGNIERYKRSLDTEKLNDFEISLETTPKANPESENNQQLTSNKKDAFHIEIKNDMVETHTENSQVEFTPEFRSDRENFDTTSENPFKTNGTASMENVELISGNENTGRAANDLDGSPRIPNPSKKDVETFVPDDNYPTGKHNSIDREKHIVPHNLHLPLNPDIPSIEDEVPIQMYHHMKKKDVNYDEDEVESFTPEYKVPHNVYRHRPRGRNGNQLEIIDEFSPQAGRLKSLIAIHLNGDTSQYTLGVHTNYKGNGHLRHAQKTFIDWKVSDWVETISATHSFHLKNGVVTVKESGLYFVYAQIYYLDEHDSNGYMVHRNSEKILQCIVTAPSSERLLKGNTCYTGGVVYLDVNDRISIDDISDGRYTLFVPGYSFFGMIKLGDIKGK